MATTSDEDKLLNIDFHFAICLLAADELIEALNDMYLAIWLLCSGLDDYADAHYRRTYHNILRHIAEECFPLTITDEFREAYEEQQDNAQD